MRFDGNGGGTKNYEPNGFDGPRQTGELLRVMKEDAVRKLRG